MKYEPTKVITIRVPRALLDQMGKYRAKEGVSATFQFVQGAELFLKSRKAWNTKE